MPLTIFAKKKKKLSQMFHRFPNTLMLPIINQSTQAKNSHPCYETELFLTMIPLLENFYNIELFLLIRIPPTN